MIDIVCTCGQAGDHAHYVYATGTVTKFPVSVSNTATGTSHARLNVSAPYMSRTKHRQLAAWLRRPRRRSHRPDERPWQPKRVLREAVAVWAVSVRSFAGR